MRRGVMMAVLVSVLLPSALGASGGIAVAKPEPKGGDGVTVEVRIGDNYFRPKKVEILVGTTLRWTNRGRNEHDIIPNERGPNERGPNERGPNERGPNERGPSKAMTFGVDELLPDQEYAATFTKPGKYAYYCSFHGARGVGQHATITVVERRPRVVDDGGDTKW